MVLIEKNFIFSSIAVIILIIKNELSAENNKTSKSYNESDFTELNLNYSVNLSSNISDPKTESLTNGRMRSFLAEDKEQQLNGSQIFENKNETKLNSSENLKEDIKNTYFYPIFNYKINSDLISDKSEKENTLQIFNESKINITSVKRPRYRFKNNSKSTKNSNPLHQNLKSFENSDKIPIISKIHNNFNETQTYRSIDENITEIKEILNTILNTNNTLIDLKEETNESFVDQKWPKYSHSNNISEKYCMSSSDCDPKLNERCIDRNKYSVCECREPFFRETTSQKCQIKKLIRLLFKVSSNHLKQINGNSLEFIQIKYMIESNIWAVIMNSSHLLTIVDNIRVIELIDSKIVVDFYVKIANPSNNFHHKYNEYHFWYQLMSIIRGIHFNENEFNSFELRAVEIVNRIDYCSVKELNYCSESAICMNSNHSEAKFECKCKTGLTDLSPNINFSGEICALKCSSESCGAGGVCHIRNDTEIQCICTDWKFGHRCQYSLYTFLCVAALFVILSIFFSICLASLYCGYKIHEEFNKLRLYIQNNPNVENSFLRNHI